jgi:hypothetical protein
VVIDPTSIGFHPIAGERHGDDASWSGQIGFRRHAPLPADGNRAGALAEGTTMAITMQGRWTLRPTTKNAAWAQRYIVSGANTGNGTHAGTVGSAAIVVDGPQWAVSIEHQVPGQGWRQSAMRIGTPSPAGGADVNVAIRSNDSAADQDYDDLILTATATMSSTDYIVYGRARSYSGFCRFNPCFPYPWLVIDTVANLRAILADQTHADIVRALYPREVMRAERPQTLASGEIELDRPLMIPVAAVGNAADIGMAFRKAPSAKASAFALATSSAKILPGSILASKLSADRLVDLASVIDGPFHPLCTVEGAPDLLLKFIEYDRTASELAGGAYLGTGSRDDLGFASTDELGNYLFRFSQSFGDLVEEFSDVAVGESVSDALRPDLIVEVIGNGPNPVLFESGLYLDVPNIRRIDLCLPYGRLHPSPVLCDGQRIIQQVGRIMTLPGGTSTFDVDGRVTIHQPPDLVMTSGAFAGQLELFGCLGPYTTVASFTVQRRTPTGGWSFVIDPLDGHLLSNPALSVSLGPTNRSLHVGGLAAQTVPSYENIDENHLWFAGDWRRKANLSTIVNGAIHAGVGSGPVIFRIEGYNAAGNLINSDEITLFLENRGISGVIESVTSPTMPPVDCALFELPAADTPLTARFVVDQPGGFLASYSLSAARGSGPTPVPIVDNTPLIQPLAVSYNPAIHGTNFRGTRNGVGPDAAGVVSAETQPVSGAWLPASTTFCAFEFVLTAGARLTNGWSLQGAVQVDEDLVGIQYP